jgi:hypothetical protein
MSNDRIINFPGTNGPEKTEAEKRVTADDVLRAAMGQYDEVVLIGIAPGKAQCISTMPIPLAVYELSRAVHRIHNRQDAFKHDTLV